MSNARKILVVGDDPVVRESLKKLLSDKGYAVTTASSGEDALWQLANGKYDAVITNMMLRGMSGLEVAEEIHARQPSVRVVIINGDGSEAVKEGAAAAGVAGLLPKHLSPEQLAESADRVLQATESVTALQSQTPEGEAASAQVMSKFAWHLKNVVLFLLAPFIGLAYLLAFPIVGLGMLAWLAFRAKEQRSEEAEPLRSAAPPKTSALKTIAMMLAVVSSGVVFAVVGPILGIGLILSTSFQAWGKLGAKAMEKSQT